MFIPAYIIEKRQEKEQRAEIPDYSKQYYEYLENKQKQEETKKETVIHIQIY